MKGLLYTVAIAVTVSVSVMAFQASAHNPQRDWRRDMALMGNDVSSFLHYQPTDQTTQGGKIRQAMHPGQVNP